MGFWVWGLGFGVWIIGVSGLGFRQHWHHATLKTQNAASEVDGCLRHSLGVGVWALGARVCGSPAPIARTAVGDVSLSSPTPQT